MFVNGRDEKDLQDVPVALSFSAQVCRMKMSLTCAPRAMPPCSRDPEIHTEEDCVCVLLHSEMESLRKTLVDAKEISKHVFTAARSASGVGRVTCSSETGDSLPCS